MLYIKTLGKPKTCFIEERRSTSSFGPSHIFSGLKRHPPGRVSLVEPEVPVRFERIGYPRPTMVRCGIHKYVYIYMYILY